jgi:hypothetical protein
MKEQITEIIYHDLMSNQLEDRVDVIRVAEEIESHVFEFIEWLKLNCHTKLGGFSGGRLWEIDGDTSQIYYGSREIYEWWFKNIKSHGGARMLPVTSSQIKSVGYASNTLYIEFTKGVVYAYANVPESHYNALGMFNPPHSVGKYFAENIKGKYDFAKTDRIVTNGELV